MRGQSRGPRGWAQVQGRRGALAARECVPPPRRQGPGLRRAMLRRRRVTRRRGSLFSPPQPRQFLISQQVAAAASQSTFSEMSSGCRPGLPRGRTRCTWSRRGSTAGGWGAVPDAGLTHLWFRASNLALGAFRGPSSRGNQADGPIQSGLRARARIGDFVGNAWNRSTPTSAAEHH
jgi:hypothetical protein